jgi:HAMP domain-containing protein
MTARSLSIKTRIILTLVLLPMISLLTVGAIALLQNRTALTEQAERTLERITLEKTTAYGHILQRVQQEAEAAAAYAGRVFAAPLPASVPPRRLLMPWTGMGYGSKELEKSLSSDMMRLQQVGQVLEAMVSTNPYLSLGYMATESGITVFDKESVVDIIEAIRAFDPRSRPWYRLAREKGRPVWTELYVDANTKKLNVTAATPVRDSAGKLLGVVGFDVLLETFQNDIINIDIGYKNEPFMIDGQGRAVVRRGMAEKNTEWDKTYQTDNLLETPNASFNSVVRRMVAGESGIVRFSAGDGTESYLAFAPLPAVGSSLGIIVPRGEIVKPVQESGKLVIIVLAVSVIVAIGFGLLLGNQVTRPIEELTVLVDKASKGLVEVQEIPIRRMDEVGVLARSFNRMLANLGTALRELEKREGSIEESGEGSGE